MVQNFFNDEYIINENKETGNFNALEGNANLVQASPYQPQEATPVTAEMEKDYYKKILKELKKIKKNKTKLKKWFPKKWTKFFKKLIERSFPIILKEFFAILSKFLFSGKWPNFSASLSV